jgi:hypothetical protein
MKKSYFVLLTVLFVIVGVTTVSAWSATWHGTSWITDSATIDAQKIAENFEYLKARTNSSTAFAYPPACVGERTVLQWDGNDWLCVTLD